MFLRALAILLCFFSLLATAQTQIQTQALSQPKHMLIGVDSWSPFRFVKTKAVGSIGEKVVSGIDDDLWHALAKKLNFQIRYIHCPWKRCLEMMKSGQIDAMSGLAWRETRAQYIQYTEPSYFQCATRFYLRRGEESILKNAQDLNNLNIGMVRGSAYYPAFDNNDQLHKTEMAQESILLQLLSAQRIDTYIGTDCQADYELAHSQWSNAFIKAPFDPKNHTPLYIGLSKQSSWSQFSQQVNQAIQLILDRGFQQDIQKKYYQDIN